MWKKLVAHRLYASGPDFRTNSFLFFFVALIELLAPPGKFSVLVEIRQREKIQGILLGVGGLQQIPPRLALLAESLAHHNGCGKP